MRIADAKVIICSPGRNFVTLKLVTEDGVSGLGDATLNGRELSVAAYLSEHLVPLLIGRDARRIEDTWQYLYKGAYWRRGPVTMAAIGAVDMALWDIRGKTLNVPVYELLGGASRESVMVYCHANGATLDETVASVAQAHRGRLHGGPRPVRRSRRRSTRTGSRATASRTSRPRRGSRSRPSGAPKRYLDFVADGVRAAAARVRLSGRTCCTTSIIG